MASTYDQVISGKWFYLPKSPWDLACCDCGLTHEISIRVKDGKPQIKMTVLHRETAQLRRQKGYLCRPPRRKH